MIRFVASPHLTSVAMSDTTSPDFVGVKRLSGKGSTVNWRFFEPVVAGKPLAPEDAVDVEAPAKLSAMEAYLYAAAKRQRTEKGVWDGLRFTSYYTSEKLLFESVAYRFQGSHSEGQIRGIFQRIKRDLGKSRKQVVKVGDPEPVQVHQDLRLRLVVSLLRFNGWFLR
jgi:hypothetical protein